MSVFQLVFSYLEATVVGLLEAARCQSSSSGGGEAFKWGRGRRFLLNFREITWNLMILCYRNTEKYNNAFTWYWLLKGSGRGEAIYQVRSDYWVMSCKYNWLVKIATYCNWNDLGLLYSKYRGRPVRIQKWNKHESIYPTAIPWLWSNTNWYWRQRPPVQFTSVYCFGYCHLLLKTVFEIVTID